jgi:hypothetical protein
MVREDPTNLWSGLVDTARGLALLPAQMIAIALFIHAGKWRLFQERGRNLFVMRLPVLE